MRTTKIGVMFIVIALIMGIGQVSAKVKKDEKGAELVKLIHDHYVSWDPLSEEEKQTVENYIHGDQEYTVLVVRLYFDLDKVQTAEGSAFTKAKSKYKKDYLAALKVFNLKCISDSTGDGPNICTK